MLTVIVDMAFTDEGLGEFLANVRAALPDTRKFPGCLSMTVLRDQNDLKRISFFEQWTSRAQYDAYLKWREGQGLIEALHQQCASPPIWRYFDTMDM